MVILFVATTIDGYIARPDGNIDWLNAIPEPDSGDYGYAELLAGIGSVVMGRKTYEEVLGFGVEWPYSDYKTVIVTRNREFAVSTPSTYVLQTGIAEGMAELERETGKDIWLVGGGELVAEFLRLDLVDKMVISVVPLVLGEGIPLFPGRSKESAWTLVEAKAFNTGLVNLVYLRKDGARNS
ncbi:MAG: dihydrofolate reductase family protein [Bacteroidia bacterium]